MQKSVFIAMTYEREEECNPLWSRRLWKSEFQFDSREQRILINEIENIVKVFYWLSYLEPTECVLLCCSCHRQ